MNERACRFTKQIRDYRKSLQGVEQQMQSEYDKAIMALSGGALGISMTFLKDVVLKQGVHGGFFLLAAWVSWGLSVSLTLWSFHTSAEAFRKAIRQTDDQTIYLQAAGGKQRQGDDLDRIRSNRNQPSQPELRRFDPLQKVQQLHKNPSLKDTPESLWVEQGFSPAF